MPTYAPSAPIVQEKTLWSNQEATKKSVLEIASRGHTHIAVVGLTGTGKTAVLESLANDPAMADRTVMSVAKFAHTPPNRKPEKPIIVYGYDNTGTLTFPTVVHRSLDFQSLSEIPEIKECLTQKPNFVEIVKDLCAIGLGSETIVKVICNDLGTQQGERAEDLFKVRIFSFLQNFTRGFNGYNLETAAESLQNFTPVGSVTTKEEIEIKLQSLLPALNYREIPSMAEAYLFKALNTTTARTFDVPGSATKYLDMARRNPNEPRLRIFIPLPAGEPGGELLEHFVTDLTERIALFKNQQLETNATGWNVFSAVELPRKASLISCNFTELSCNEVMTWCPEEEQSYRAFRHMQEFSVTKPERGIYLVAGDHDWNCTPDALAFVALAE